MGKHFTFDICLRCSKRQETCCNCGQYAPFTIKDINNAKKLGYNEKDFLIVRAYSKSDIAGNEKWWVNSFFKKGKKNYKLNVRKFGKECFFLTPGKGCRLGKNRPAVCKIYPSWIDKNGKIIYEPGEKKECLMGKKGYPIMKCMKILNEDEKKIRKNYNDIKQDCINNKEKHKKIILKLLKNSL